MTKAETDCKMTFARKRLRVTGAKDCINDIFDMGKMAFDIFSQVKSGAPDFSQIISDAQEIANDVTDAVSDCHKHKMADFQFGVEGSCEEDLQTLAQDALDLAHSVSSGDWAKAAEDVLKLK